ncbi:Fic family protein, partial [Bacillus sp. FJAT-45350]
TEKYRQGPVYLMDEDVTKTEPIYVAPDANYVQPMMDDLFTFIHSDEVFINPLLKASIIHFYLVYIHPFYDGNGRVARAFSYMYLLKNGYDFYKFFSISTVVNQKKKKYYKAIKDTEDYESDLTYFLLAYSKMTLLSMSDMIEKLTKEVDHEVLLKQLDSDEIILSPRQKKFLKYMKRKETNITTIEEYKKRSKVVYETARRDLMELSELGIFKKVKKGKKHIFKYVGLKGYSE